MQVYVDFFVYIEKFWFILDSFVVCFSWSISSLFGCCARYILIFNAHT